MGRFTLGLMLACAAWLTLGITEINEDYIFANPGIVEAKAANLVQWAAVATQEHATLSTYLSPTKYGIAVFLSFIFPPFCLPLWHEESSVRKWINGAQALLLLLDVVNMMQFNGYNSANGGYDGAGEIGIYGLYGLFGTACGMLFLTRLLWKMVRGLSKC